MTLAKEDIQFIKDHLGEWLAEQSIGKPPAVYEVELRERMVRVEEELGHQRELIKTILVQMDKRFEAMQREMDKRFDAVDRRFEALARRIDRFMIWSFATTLTVLLCPLIEERMKGVFTVMSKFQKSIDHVVDGFENTPAALRNMLSGAWTGKTLVRFASVDGRAAS